MQLKKLTKPLLMLLTSLGLMGCLQTLPKPAPSVGTICAVPYLGKFRPAKNDAQSTQEWAVGHNAAYNSICGGG